MASHNLPQSPLSGKSPISKSGVLTIHGFGVRVRMQSGHLEIEDGVGLERRRLRLPRVGHGLKRLICLSEDGFCTLAALNWLSEIGVPCVMLDKRGKVRFVTSPTAASDSRLHRSQALAISSGVGLKICCTLIDAKLKKQEQVAREQLKDAVTADAIAQLRLFDLPKAESFEHIRTIEARAAVSYFGSLRNIPVIWPKADTRRIPSHWHEAGPRQSPLSGGPRLAVTPFHAIENYCSALVESESRLAVSALGLLPDLSLGLHADRPYRDSLVFDVCEPVRPALESWLIRWVSAEPLQRRDFFEAATGNVRLTSNLCAKLSETAPVWGKFVAPWAEYVAHELWSSIPGTRIRALATRLTQRTKREVKGSSVPEVKQTRPEHVCRGCGKVIRRGRTNCADCAIGGASERLASAARLGRVAARNPESRAKHSVSRRRHAQACSAWDASSQPEWLTAKLYSEKIQPLLAHASASAIARKIGVSRWYAGRIREGYRPHPRHWQALAELVGMARKL